MASQMDVLLGLIEDSFNYLGETKATLEGVMEGILNQAQKVKIEYEQMNKVLTRTQNSNKIDNIATEVSADVLGEFMKGETLSSSETLEQLRIEDYTMKQTLSKVETLLELVQASVKLNSKTNSALEHMSNNYVTHINTSNKVIDALASNCKTLQVVQEELRETITVEFVTQGKVDSLETQMGDMHEEFREVKETNKRTKNQIIELERNKEELEKSIIDNQKDIDSLEVGLKKTNSEVKEVKGLFGKIKAVLTGNRE